MIRPELKTLLLRWGRVFGVRPAPEWDEDSSEGMAGSTHALARALRVASKPARLPVRLRSFAGANGEIDIERAPEIVSHGRESRSGQKGIFIPADAERVELAVLDLYRNDRLRAVVLRMEYCAGRIGRKEKAGLAGEKLGIPMTTSRFRHELDFAHFWIDGCLTGQRALHRSSQAAL